MGQLRQTPPEEWQRVEGEEHDGVYASSAAHEIDVQRFLSYEDYCYVKGARPDRGHRTRKALQAIGVGDLSGQSILDIGCGNGRYAVFLALLGATVHGCDISPVGVHHATALAKVNGVSDRCYFSVQNACNMSYPDGAFDVVLLHESLHHAIKYPGVHDEIIRVLRPGAKAVIAEGLYGNFILSLGRHVTMRGNEAKGDVILRLEDLHRFGEGFSDCQIEMMSLLFMAKRVFQSHMDSSLVRFLMRTTKRLDDVLLSSFPFLARYCGECVAVLTK